MLINNGFGSFFATPALRFTKRRCHWPSSETNWTDLLSSQYFVIIDTLFPLLSEKLTSSICWKKNEFMFSLWWGGLRNYFKTEITSECVGPICHTINGRNRYKLNTHIELLARLHFFLLSNCVMACNGTWKQYFIDEDLKTVYLNKCSFEVHFWLL